MGKTSFPMVVCIIAATHVFSAPAFSASADVQAALAVIKQMHTDQCQQQQLRGQLLIAHQSHDQEKLSELGPQLEAINERLRPSDDKLKALKASIKGNTEDQSEFEKAQLEMGDCD